MKKELSFKSRPEIEAYQSRCLVKQLAYVSQNSPFYQTHLAGHDVGDISSTGDLVSLPVTSKAHLQRQNMDFLCVESAKIIDYITTSGTTGNPITFALTDKDLDRLADNEYASFLCAEGSGSDIYQLMLTLDRRF
ncbi:MAG: phenylacetate--CoA ligase family protein, partial [Bacteroidales bacterium]|nr:phenylacetate--CoA ligase family protein [Bacteroidales bacterium]